MYQSAPNRLPRRRLADPRLVSVPAAILFATALALVTIAGCKKDVHGEGDGHGHDHDHDHASERTPPHGDDHDHDHDHDHGHDAEHADEVHLTAEAVERHGVTVEAAQAQVLRATFVAPARVAFNTEAMAHVGSPLRGRVIELKVRLGDVVRRGDALVVIESPELGEAQAEYLQRRSAVQSAGPGVELAKVAWERARGLHEQSQGISLNEVQRREAEHRAAVAGLKAAEAAAIGAENRLHLLGMSQPAIEALAATGEIDPRHTIVAAIDGQVVEREVTLGELVSPDRESIMVLADTSTLWVLADVPEARLQEVAVGTVARVTIGTVDSRGFDGIVAFVAPSVDPTTRTAQVRIEVPSKAMALRPGMFAQVEIVATDPVAGVPAPAIAVPDEAVQVVEGGPAVFVPVPDEPNTFAKRAVVVGRSVGGLVPVHSGLVAGEPFVRSGSFILKAELGKAGAAHEH
ncbi:MAG: efflux RND transporter periplasmic adaptor subunit [Phycisphaerales bacterium]